MVAAPRGPFHTARIHLSDTFQIVNLADNDRLSSNHAFYIGSDSISVKIFDSNRSCKIQKKRRYEQKNQNLQSERCSRYGNQSCRQCAAGEPYRRQSHRDQFNDYQYYKQNEPHYCHIYIHHRHHLSPLSLLYYYIIQTETRFSDSFL